MVQLTPLTAIKFTDIAPVPDRRIMVYLEVSLEPPQANKCIAPPLPQNLDEAKEKLKIPGTLIYVYVAVQDSGPGLKPGDLTLLFQRFQQGEYHPIPACSSVTQARIQGPTRMKYSVVAGWVSSSVGSSVNSWEATSTSTLSMDKAPRSGSTFK